MSNYFQTATGSAMNITEKGRWGKEKDAKFRVFSSTRSFVRLEVTIDGKMVMLNVPRTICEEMAETGWNGAKVIRKSHTDES